MCPRAIWSTSEEKKKRAVSVKVELLDRSWGIKVEHGAQYYKLQRLGSKQSNNPQYIFQICVLERTGKTKMHTEDKTK